MGVVENVNDIAELIKKFGDIDLNRKILTLETEVLDLTRDKRRAEDKIEELARALKFKGDLKFKEPFYWLENDLTPYCTGCWDAKKQAIHVVPAWAPDIGHVTQCPACKHNYFVRRGV